MKICLYILTSLSTPSQSPTISKAEYATPLPLTAICPLSAARPVPARPDRQRSRGLFSGGASEERHCCLRGEQPVQRDAGVAGGTDGG